MLFPLIFQTMSQPIRKPQESSAFTDAIPIAEVQMQAARNAEAPKAEQTQKKALGVETATIGATRLIAYMQSRPVADGTFQYGPNFDGCYYYRVAATDEKQGSDFGANAEVMDAQKKKALGVGVPNYNQVGWPEETLINLCAYLGRSRAIEGSEGKEEREAKGTLVAKHFPGTGGIKTGEVGRALEGTEKKDATIEGDLREFKPALRSFELAFHCAYPVQGVMTAHAIYPDLSEDMAKKYGTDKYFDPSDPVPATFSPYILGGLLRKEMKFKGIAISDWADMGAVKRFCAWAAQKEVFTIKNEQGEREVITDPNAIVTISAVHAGLNIIAGGNRIEGEGLEQVNRFAAQNPAWAKKLDDIMRADLGWYATRYEDPRWKRDPKQMNMEQKMEVLYGPMHGPEGEWAPQYSPSADYSDLWNRKGLMLMQLRKCCVEAMTGTRYPDLTEYTNRKGGRGRTDGDAFLKALFAAPGFKEAYEKVDWESPQTQKAFDAALKQILTDEKKGGERLARE